MASNKAIIESLLYVGGNEGVTIAEIKRVVDLPTDDIRKILKEMKKECDESPNRGVTIECYGDFYKFLSKPELNDQLSKIFEIKTKNPLTQTMLETLAIIAYNSPCSASKVEQIRGHDASSAVARLTALGLIKNVGRADTPGRPYLYEVTPKFFDTFGIKSLNELPSINESLLGDEFDINSDTVDFFNSSRDE